MENKKFGPTRGSILTIFEQILYSAFVIIGIIIGYLFLGDETLDSIMELVFILLIKPISKFFQYFFTKYTVDNEHFIISSGFFVKKKVEIPIINISTVDYSQNVILRIFGVYKLKVDNSCQDSESAKKAELEVLLKKKDAIYVRGLLLNNNQSEIEDKKEIHNHVNNKKIESEIIFIPESSFALGSILKFNITYIISALVVIICILQVLEDVISEEYANRIFIYAENFYERIDGKILFQIVFGIFILLGSFICSSLFNLVKNMVKYYKFTIKNSKDSLNIQFGLFTKQNYSLMKDKICGISATQTFIMRLFGYAKLDVYVIGYGDEININEQSIIHPCIKTSLIKKFTSKVLPDIDILDDYSKSQKNTLFYYFRFLVVFIVIISTGMFLFIRHAIIWILWLIIMSLLILSRIYKYKLSGVSLQNNTIIVANGGLGIEKYYFPVERVDSLVIKTTRWKCKKKIYDILFYVRGPLLLRYKKVRLLDKSVVYSINNKWFESVKDKL